jgi:hypothetical protein
LVGRVRRDAEDSSAKVSQEFCTIQNGVGKWRWLLLQFVIDK